MGIQHSVLQSEETKQIPSNEYRKAIDKSRDAVLVVAESLSIVACNFVASTLIAEGQPLCDDAAHLHPVMEIIPTAQPGGDDGQEGMSLKEVLESCLAQVYSSPEGQHSVTLHLQKLSLHRVWCKIWFQFVSWGSQNAVQMIIREIFPGEEISLKYMTPDTPYDGAVKIFVIESKPKLSPMPGRPEGARADDRAAMKSGLDGPRLNASGTGAIPVSDDALEAELLHCLDHMKTIVQGIDNSRLIMTISDQVDDAIANHVRAVFAMDEKIQKKKADMYVERQKHRERVKGLEAELMTLLDELEAQKDAKAAAAKDKEALTSACRRLKDKTDAFFKESREWNENI